MGAEQGAWALSSHCSLDLTLLTLALNLHTQVTALPCLSPLFLSLPPHEKAPLKLKLIKLPLPWLETSTLEEFELFVRCVMRAPRLPW